MQGTQYAPRESILCREHFVALQCCILHLITILHTHAIVGRCRQLFEIIHMCEDLVPIPHMCEVLVQIIHM